MLRIFKNVANIEETIKMLQCLLCLQSVANVAMLFIKKVFKDFASVAKTLKMLQVLRNLQIVVYPLNVTKFAVPS